ncbi:hypothetical protein QPK87_04755 [Kamptonema cortianum]|nr:hypothetical protein [Geitlerinema splendidum]MDK3155886.1 hypothetical protein [Kamptonema cortianum]
MFWRWLEVVLDSGSGVRSTQLIGAGGGGLREFIRADYLTVECVLNDLGIRQWIPLLVRWGLGRKVSSDVVLQGEALLCALSELVKNEVVN